MENKAKFYLLIVFISFLFTSCMEKKSNDPNEVYKLWSGNEPTNDIKVINGKYWSSTHFTYEYETYLELKTSTEWLNKFIKENKLKVATSSIDLPYDAPNWFDPKLGLKAFVPSGFSQGSIYFVNMKTGYILFYEIQL